MSHRIVVVGGGAGGLELATRLGRKLGRSGRATVTLVDAQITHVWKPLLHEVAAGALNVSENELNFLAQAKWNHFNFQLGRMCGVNRQAKLVTLAPMLDEKGYQLVSERTIPYDTLVIAVGSVTNDFGTPGAAEHCVFLDTTANAEEFHRRLLQRYLVAHAHRADEARMNIAIVGAGATGVELAAELRNTATQAVNYGLNGIRPDEMRICLIDSGPRVLPALPETFSHSAADALKKLNVEIRTSTRVGEVRSDGLISESGEFIPAELMVWAAGVRAPSFLESLDGLETNRLSQLQVTPTLQTTVDENIFAMGDCAACPLADGSNRLVPPRAQAAHQQAALLARSLIGVLNGHEPLVYRYQDLGSFVSLSTYNAVGSLMGNLLGTVNVSGWMARMVYASLYRLHQAALYGATRTALLVIGDRINRKRSPALKLH